MTAPGLRIADLAARFGDAPGLADVSLDVAAGERLAVVGTSGAGKTTLLRAVAGLAPVDAGRIEVAGRDVTALPPERRDAVYLHQTPLLFPHLSVGENVAFPLRVRGRTDGDVRRRTESLLRAVGLDGFAERRPSTLSGGQKHRVALARAIAAEPAVLLLDEPLSSLDPWLRQEVRDAVVAVQQETRPALVLVTHDLDEAGLMGHRVAVLLGGRVAQVAAPGELFARPASLAVARFLGIPNEVPGEVDARGVFRSALGAIPVGDATTPGPAVALFRPDALRIIPDGAVSMRVAGMRHRASGATVVLRVGSSTLEMAAGASHLAADGEVRVAVDPSRVLVFPASP